MPNENHSLDWTLKIGKAGGDSEVFDSTILSSVVHDRYQPAAREQSPHTVQCSVMLDESD